MPSGNTHNLINLSTFAVLGSAALYLQRAGSVDFSRGDALGFTVGFFVGTFLLSPDLDLAEQNVNSKRAWGFLGVLWVPYGMMFSHRGWSHSWLVGPLTRLVYLALIVGLVVGLVRLVLPGAALPSLPVRLDWPVALPLLAGYYVSQWLHLIADGVRPDHKMRFRRR
ncbi:metal-binding protein [Deinococcus pimensis]|uniref:metal-binding protein n=1 Tax=Deinococcus pimensis TaxID=309888 RepID=UPI000488E00B|nr:metal-binding protein [Deinococcus pimensis]